MVKIEPKSGAMVILIIVRSGKKIEQEVIGLNYELRDASEGYILYKR